MERVKGIEPSLEAWEAPVLPLNYTRLGKINLSVKSRGGDGYIIYTLGFTLGM